MLGRPLHVCLVLALGACGFSGGASAPSGDDQPGSDAGSPDAAPDAPPPIACGDLTCDGHATCLTNPARCECSAGYTGDGMTCTDVDECAVANGSCAAACANTDGSFACYAPATCGEIATRVPGFTGGARTLYFQGMATKPWTATCVGSGQAWKEYLSLTSANNYAQYTSSGQGTSVRTTFTKVRIVPATAKIDIADQTYATSTGSLSHSGTAVTSMPYAVAMDCGGNNSNTGVARMDLAGTPFVITETFVLGGAQPDGTTSPTNGGRQVTLTGGGNCGWAAPAPVPYNPFNQITGGAILDIGYVP